ncbi:hypothetical protein ElyMa_003094600 [Elysia marginata]|uniref:Uncharacterized protein n=1 Tax=Elysia marginata TaxID=1093978 RepID=A0AAV4IPX0_9GAST|nr:hypothetical protein ElyMa_003094600 [Elysia marginata]
MTFCVSFMVASYLRLICMLKERDGGVARHIEISPNVCFTIHSNDEDHEKDSNDDDDDDDDDDDMFMVQVEENRNNDGVGKREREETDGNIAVFSFYFHHLWMRQCFSPSQVLMLLTVMLIVSNFAQVCLAAPTLNTDVTGVYAAIANFYQTLSKFYLGGLGNWGGNGK